MEKTLADGEVIVTSLMLKEKQFFYIGVLCIFGVFLKVASNTSMYERLELVIMKNVSIILI